MDKNISEYFKKAAAEVQNNFDNVSDIRLEEYDKESEEIIVSFLVPKPMKTNAAFAMINAVPTERVYKIIQFDAEQNVSKVKIYH